MARFGRHAVPNAGPLQLVLAVSFSALLAASAVAQEKDRRTLVLLLLTRLDQQRAGFGQIVGRHAQRVGTVGRFVAAVHAYGTVWRRVVRSDRPGIRSDAGHVLWSCGSMGSMIALWREKTFQTLALTVLVLVFGWPLAKPSHGAQWGQSGGALPPMPGQWASVPGKPFKQPRDQSWPRTKRFHSLARRESVFAGLGGADRDVNGLAILLVRVWNPSRRPERVSKRGPRVKAFGELSTIWPPRDLSRRLRQNLRSTPREAKFAAFGTIRSCGEKSAPGPMAARC